METFSVLLAICAGNSPVPGEFPAQRPVTRNFDVFFDLRLNKRLSKQTWGWWLETLLCSLWRHCNATISHEISSGIADNIICPTRHYCYNKPWLYLRIIPAYIAMLHCCWASLIVYVGTFLLFAFQWCSGRNWIEPFDLSTLHMLNPLAPDQSDSQFNNNFQIYFYVWCLERLYQNCIGLCYLQSYWQLINIDSADALMPPRVSFINMDKLESQHG